MKEPDEAATTGLSTCPFLRSVVADWIWMYPTSVYCQHPSGRVRVPSEETVARFCTSGRHADCPGYRRAFIPETGQEFLQP